jgi:hypothetical protein
MARMVATNRRKNAMNNAKSTMAHQIAQAAIAFEPRAAGDLAGACGHGENLIVLVPDSPRLPGNGPGARSKLSSDLLRRD